MLEINELENGLIVGVYEGGYFKEEIATDKYKTELGSYDVGVNFINHDWDCEEYIEYDEFTPTSRARIKAFYDKITLDNTEGIVVDIMPIQNCMKTIVGYKGKFYRGFEAIFKRKEDICEKLESFKWSSESLLKRKFNVKQVNIILGRGYSNLTYFEYDFFDNTDKSVYIQSMYKVETPLSFTLEDFKITGQVNYNIPCKISFTYYMYKNFLEVRVNNIMFYVEKNLEFSVNNKLANFKIRSK
jgi:hypothetical protein